MGCSVDTTPQTVFFRRKLTTCPAKNETPVLHLVPHSAPDPTASCVSAPLVPQYHEARRRWTTGELTEIVAALATLRTDDIARVIGVNPKALRSALLRRGISLRSIREHAKRSELSQGIGVTVRRSTTAPAATYGADALVGLDDSACRWPTGDPSKPHFHFCGAPRSGHKSYCREHLSQSLEREGGHGL